MADLAVIGTGYVGLVTGACLADLEHDVVCADIDADKIDALRRNEIPIFEEGLGGLVARGLSSGNLRFEPMSGDVVADREFVYLCVPTPEAEDGSVDLTYLETAAKQIGESLPPDAIVVNKSTVPVGSTKLVERVIGRSDIGVVSNPEFLREGSAVQDFMHPDRIVIGSDDQSAAIRVAALYLSLGVNLMVTDPASAETIKYASNAFLATKLSFVNAVAAICEAVGADVNDVVLGMGYDPRIGREFLRPGPGWGGSCFPKDTRALVQIAADAGYDFSLLRGVIEVNEEQFDRVADRVERACGGSLEGRVLLLLGLAFKAGTDDVRRSPALEVADRLVARGAVVRAFDPQATVTRQGVEQVADLYDGASGAHAIVALTEWDDFKWLDAERLAAVMESAVAVDTRSVLDRAALRRQGFDVHVLGRG